MCLKLLLSDYFRQCKEQDIPATTAMDILRSMRRLSTSQSVFIDQAERAFLLYLQLLLNCENKQSTYSYP